MSESKLDLLFLTSIIIYRKSKVLTFLDFSTLYNRYIYRLSNGNLLLVYLFLGSEETKKHILKKTSTR